MQLRCAKFTENLLFIYTQIIILKIDTAFQPCEDAKIVGIQGKLIED